jgi:3-oxoacyl-[acyl-carrier protein] reductase
LSLGTDMPTVLITGGTRGIGLALCKAFAAKGWNIASCYHQDEDSATQSAKELSALQAPYFLTKCDVSVESEVSILVQTVLEKFGSVDCLIHNAGATWNARILNVEEAQWDATLDVHLKGAFLLSKAVLKPMLKRKLGHLIFISSVVATTGNIGQGGYTAAKAGVIGLARSLAREYGIKNIQANVVCPGFHMTRIADGLSPEAVENIRERHLLGKTTDLNEVCEFMIWLAGTKTVSGQVFNLDSRLPGWI